MTRNRVRIEEKNSSISLELRDEQFIHAEYSCSTSKDGQMIQLKLFIVTFIVIYNELQWIFIVKKSEYECLKLLVNTISHYLTHKRFDRSIWRSSWYSTVCQLTFVALSRFRIIFDSSIDLLSQMWTKQIELVPYDQVKKQLFSRIPQADMQSELVRETRSWTLKGEGAKHRSFLFVSFSDIGLCWRSHEFELLLFLRHFPSSHTKNKFCD